jgi:glycosyltransferase involved in cell wall biosynthesis
MINENISVIIPAYNSEKTIGKCLRAIKEQSLSALEVIVVDDGSIDRTVEIAKEFTTVIPNTHSKGASGARNTGADAAKGEIIAFIDSDCIPPKNWLKNIASVFFDETISAVGGGYSAGLDHSFWQMFCCEELAFRRRNKHGQVKTLVSNNFACRKSVFLAEKGFPEEYRVCEDMFLSYKISQRGKVQWLNDNGVQHRFKGSLKEYLKHQYYFGAESIRFFLQNPSLLTIDHHQGRTLHVAIISAFLFVLSALLTALFIILGNFELSRLFINIFVLLLLIHFLLYLRFIRYLVKIKFSNIGKAYGVSLLRDLVCNISILDGILRAIKNPKSHINNTNT